MTTTYTEIREKLDQGFTSYRQFSVVLICFFLNMADGFDVISISMTAPSIVQEWGISASMLGLVLSAEMIGMTIGALLLSLLSDRYGRRPIIIAAMAMVAGAMLFTAFCSNVTQLMMLRLITGVGIGGVLVAAVPLAGEYAPESKRNAVTIAIATSFVVGSILAGPIINYILASHSWHDVFLFGGCLATVLFVAAVFLLPESLEYLSNKECDNDCIREQHLANINRILKTLKHAPVEAMVYEQKDKDIKAGSVLELLSKDYRAQTIQLWLIFFVAYWNGYFLLKWMPKLLVDLDFDISVAIYALTIYLIGGVVGSVIAAVLSTKFNIKRLSTIAFALMGVMLLGFSLAEPSDISELHIYLFLMGVFGIGGFHSMYAIGSNGYPPQLRSSGLGYCIGIGRAGAILSPIVAGFMVQQGWGIYGLFLILSVPAAFLCAIFLQRLKMYSDA